MRDAGRGSFGGLSRAQAGQRQGTGGDAADDALFTERPFFGARRIAKTLCEDGFPIDRKRVRRLMRLMGIAALGPKPGTSQPAPGHKIYPYLLRGLSIDPEPGLGGRHHLHPDRQGLSVSGRRHRLGEPGSVVLAAFEHARGFVLRRGVGGGVGALGQAGNLQHRPGQSIHRRGLHRCVDRRWRSHLDGWSRGYLKGYADGREAKLGIREWIAFYNDRRLHQALDYRTPMAVWRESAAAPTCGHVDNACALTTSPQEEQNKKLTHTLAA